LLEEIISKPQGSLCSSVRAERDRAGAKRDRVYQKLQHQQLEMEIQDHNGEGGAPNHPVGASVPTPATIASARSSAWLASIELIALYLYAS